MQFPHEQLSVYQKALVSFGDINRLISSWSTQHAFVDHLSRASESILFNLVEAARLGQNKKKLLTLDYAVGSVFECSACFDIAVLKGILNQVSGKERKVLLLEICKMLIGLRNSWMAQHVAESGDTYTVVGDKPDQGRVFHHEQLDMYILALEFYRWFLMTESGRRLDTPFDKSIDTLATRMVLNIAEGNGRYAELLREGFLDTANAAAARLAASLDMGASRGIWTTQEIDDGKKLLVRVGQMTARKGYAAQGL
jgi:four helix bundle protein